METLQYIIRIIKLPKHGFLIATLLFILMFSIVNVSNAEDKKKCENKKGDHNKHHDDDDDDDDDNCKKITICHKTHSQSNPWVTITISKSAWDKHKKHGDTKGACGCNCPMILDVIGAKVDLGEFFPGSIYDLPSSSGDGNILEFILVGGYGHSYDFSFDMETTYILGSGKAIIKNWTWEKADKSSNGRYGSADNNRTSGYYDIELYRQTNPCKAYAKFRLTAKKLKVTSNATSGRINFTITVSAAVNL